MKKSLATISIFLLINFYSKAQVFDSYELAIGTKFQKTEQLYWENGLAADFTSNFLMKKKMHLKLAYVTSRMGSAFHTNAIKQDNYQLGVDWRFRSTKNLQLFAGLNSGFFHADMETAPFEVLPHHSMLFSIETGIYYKFKFPMATSISVGYNVINGDGVNAPGTLFPVFYQMSIFYCINKTKK